MTILETSKIKVKSIQLGKTLGLTKVPITKTEESTLVQKQILFKTCLTPRGGGAGFPIEGGGRGGHSTMEVIPPPL